MPLQFAIIAYDKPRSGELRALHRDAHRARLRGATAPPVKVVKAGPLLSHADEPIGSLILVEADSHTDVERFVAGDPYVVEGVFEKVDIKQFKWTIEAQS